jgi:EF hand
MGFLIRVGVFVGLAVLAGAGCAPGGPDGSGLARDPRAASSQVGEIRLNIALMLSYDANKDGSVTREEVESGLRAQFERADADRNGRLSLSEMQAENARRWQESRTASSPLIDWNLDGVVSFAEFSGTAQSVFAQLDRDRGGTLAGTELEAPRVRGTATPAPRGRSPAALQAPDRTFRPF